MTAPIFLSSRPQRRDRGNHSAEPSPMRPIYLSQAQEFAGHCRSCEGTGRSLTAKCVLCFGTGQCENCDGTGRIVKTSARDWLGESLSKIRPKESRLKRLRSERK